MKTTLINKSHISTVELIQILDWLAPSFGEVGMPVKITVVSKMDRMGVWGKAYWPTKNDNRRNIKPGEYSIKIFVGGEGTYPRTFCYKKRAGAMTYNNQNERLFEVIAHEMRHVEQFAACAIRMKSDPHLFKKLPYYAHFSFSFRHYETKVAGYASNSCEVDAELVAHGLLKAYRNCNEMERMAA